MKERRLFIEKIAALSKDWNLPKQDNEFVDRKELQDLYSFFACSKNKEGNEIVVCTGLGGIGKTQLALKYIHSSGGRYNLKAWFSAENILYLKEQYIEFTKILDCSIESPSLKQAQDNVNQYLSDYSGWWLLVFDNVEDYKEIKPFLPVKGGHIIITSRYQGWPNTFKKLPINKMSEHESIQLMKSSIGKNENFSDNEEEDLKLLVEELDYLPLAVTQAGACIGYQGISIAVFLEKYKNDTKRMLEYDKTLLGTKHVSVAVTFLFSIKEIEKKMEKKLKIPSLTIVKLLLLCAYFSPEQIPREILFLWFSKIYPKDPSIIDELLGELHNQSLIKIDQNTVSLHRVVQKVIRLYHWKSLPRKWYCNLIDCVNEELKRETKDCFKDDDRKKALFPHLISLINSLDLDKNFPLRNKYSVFERLKTFFRVDQSLENTIANFFIGTSIIYELLGMEECETIKYCTNALMIKEKYYGKGSLRTVHALIRLGICDKHNSEKHFRDALEIEKKYLPHNYIRPFVVADPKVCLANVLRCKKETQKEAKKLYQESINNYNETNKDPKYCLKHSSLLVNYGVLEEQLGNLEKAITLMEKALDIRRSFGTSKSLGIAAVLTLLANAYFSKVVFRSYWNFVRYYSSYPTKAIVCTALYSYAQILCFTSSLLQQQNFPPKNLFWQVRQTNFSSLCNKTKNLAQEALKINSLNYKDNHEKVIKSKELLQKCKWLLDTVVSSPPPYKLNLEIISKKVLECAVQAANY